MTKASETVVVIEVWNEAAPAEERRKFLLSAFTSPRESIDLAKPESIVIFPRTFFGPVRYGAYDASAVTVRFASGAVASLLIADAGENAHAGKWLHEIFDGHRSAVLYDHFRQVRCSGAELDHFAAADELRADGTYGVLEDFVRAIRENTRAAITGRDGLRATVLALKIHESLRSGTPQEVRLDGDD